MPEPPAGGSHYAAIGDLQGGAYERNAFARGTRQEVPVLGDLLRLEPGMRLLDVGCGTGRHAREFAGRGVDVVGVDLSAGLLACADRRLPGRWVRADASSLPFPARSFDAALCVCQGGFSIGATSDRRALAEMSRVARRGARLALTAYSRAFAVRFLAPGDAMHVHRGLVHTRAEVRDRDGHEHAFDLWTQCYDPGELASLGAGIGLELETITGAEPGHYTRRPPLSTDPELLSVFFKP